MNDMEPQFLVTWTASGGARIQAVRTLSGGLFRKSRTEFVAPAEWLTIEALAAGVLLTEMVDRGQAFERDGAVELLPNDVAALSEATAISIGFPPAAPLLLGLSLRGLVVDDGFRIERRWRALDGTELAARVTGARVSMGGRDFRLPEPLFGLAADADAVGDALDLPARQSAYAELQRRLGEDGSRVLTDSSIAETRVGFAGHFSLSLNGDDFDPVLFAPHADTDGSADERADNLLSPDQQIEFARAFRATTGKRGAYLLSGGLLLFLDPALRSAMEVVGAKQRAPSAERRAFAANPRPLLADGYEETGGFIETVQYSDRVVGIDPWRAPVLPWVKARPNSWLPEAFGVAVGEPPDQKQLEVPLGKANDLLATAKIAAETGGVVHINGVDVLATPQLVSALEDLASFEKAVDQADRNKDGAVAPSINRLFLQVRDNLEEVTFAPPSIAASPVPPPPPTPAAVRTTLKPHQIEGFHWLSSAWGSGRPGALLADDMGLGKTLQALTFLVWLRSANAGPALIVAPTGLLANWRAEMERHLEPLALGRMVRAYGDGLAALRQGAGTDTGTGAPRLDKNAMADAGVVLTTYESLRDYHMSFAGMRFSCVLFDEVQKLKNPAAQVTRAAKTLRARFTLAMTGTPVENRLQDLWSITDVAHPSLLGSSKAFEARFGAAGEAELRELQSLLTTPSPPWPAFMLRRMKDGVVEGLPKKQFVTKAEPMPPAQARAYGEAINRALALRGTASNPAMIETLGRLRALSLGLGVPVPGPNFAENSARLVATLAILDGVAKRGEKALIFLEAIAWQAPLAAELRRRYGLKHTIPIISGSTPGDERRRMVDVFQGREAGFDAMILSPRAGGVGLTITAANHVIHLSRWWNPAVEDQATDRAYRIGQTLDVTVWVPIAKHPALGQASFDHKLDALLRRKRSLALGLLAEPEGSGDAAELLDGVLSEAPSFTADDVLAYEPANSTEPSSPSASNRHLSRRIEKRVGQDPPWDIFLDVLTGARVIKLEIVDPYAMGSAEACRAFARFIARLDEASADLGTVRLMAQEGQDLAHGLREPAEQYRALSEAVQHFELQNVRIDPILYSARQKKLHDRSVRAFFADGDTIVWDLGTGIEGFIQPRKPCTVVRTSE